MVSQNTKKAAIIGTIVFVTAAFFVFWDKQPKEDAAPLSQHDRQQTLGPSVLIGNTTVQVTIANTPALRQQGLSGHPGLAPNEGMLFLFEHPGQYGFWMKDMLFPIDIIWIGENWRIVDITPSLAPETFPEAFFPSAPVQYVLEVSAGFSTEHALSIGEFIHFSE